ncbi:hypothetical protein B0T25DRAFT_73582 [Lasiosphaeria hispida]|uniref:Uncharacterized protein n=1 Tax=Lasiosphaeria hispida TaxID=260671 RepID=A0AAJ0MH26_9PEZI|nr:hypothetical protein B0T25DRAFT_73582 [Lasiosphaeria hispida]
MLWLFAFLGPSDTASICRLLLSFTSHTASFLQRKAADRHKTYIACVLPLQDISRYPASTPRGRHRHRHRHRQLVRYQAPPPPPPPPICQVCLIPSQATAALRTLPSLCPLRCVAVLLSRACNQSVELRVWERVGVRVCARRASSVCASWCVYVYVSLTHVRRTRLMFLRTKTSPHPHPHTELR